MSDDLGRAVDALADEVPNGHLLAATDGADLLHEAARLLREQRADLAAAARVRDLALGMLADLLRDRDPRMLDRVLERAEDLILGQRVDRGGAPASWTLPPPPPLRIDHYRVVDPATGAVLGEGDVPQDGDT